jgi:uncharacterized protein YdhG (YjbR/CyaY superfamily)
MKMKSYKTVDAYIKSFPKETASRLRLIRKIIRGAAPKAAEGISYGMAAYKFNDSPLIYFAAFKKHIGVYAMPSTTKALMKVMTKYKTSKGTVQFQHDEPLPLPLIRRIVAYRVKESRAKNARMAR